MFIVPPRVNLKCAYFSNLSQTFTQCPSLGSEQMKTFTMNSYHSCNRYKCILLLSSFFSLCVRDSFRTFNSGCVSCYLAWIHWKNRMQTIFNQDYSLVKQPGMIENPIAWCSEDLRTEGHCSGHRHYLLTIFKKADYRIHQFSMEVLYI